MASRKKTVKTVSYKQFAVNARQIAQLQSQIKGFDQQRLSVFNTAQDHRITALEEAICPRVAARLTALERMTLGINKTINTARPPTTIREWLDMRDGKPAHNPTKIMNLVEAAKEFVRANRQFGVGHYETREAWIALATAADAVK